MLGEVAKLGLRAIAIPADVTREADRAALVKRAQEELGQIDILVNNVRIISAHGFGGKSQEDMIQIVETNLMAPLFLTRKLLPGMLECGCGHIVNIASMAGKKGIPNEVTYTASKTGLVEFSNALRTELEGTGVDASVICPVYVSRVGMFAVYEVPAPRLAGSISPQQVSKAVIRVIRQNIGELIVGPSPTRPLLALNALSPRLGDLIIKSMGVR